MKSHELKAMFDKAEYKPGKAHSKMHKPEPSLGVIWQTAVSESTGAFVPALTIAERGQLKHLTTKVGKSRAAHVIRWAAANWILFVKSVEQDAGIKTTPAKPSIGFLLKHAGIAVGLMQEPSPVSTTPEVLHPTVEPSVPETEEVISEDPEDQKPKSLAELLAIEVEPKHG